MVYSKESNIHCFLIFEIRNDSSDTMIRKLYRLKKNNITLFQFIVEGYEGMATVSTIDPKTAVIQVLIMPDFVDEIIGAF